VVKVDSYTWVHAYLEHGVYIVEDRAGAGLGHVDYKVDVYAKYPSCP
jgi:hypothetical protein